MDSWKQQMEVIHSICQTEFSALQTTMQRYLQDSERIKKLMEDRSVALMNGLPGSGYRGVNNMFALIAFDRYMTQMSTSIGMARKFNIHFQLNALDKIVLDPTETYDTASMGMVSTQRHSSQSRLLQDYIEWSNSCTDSDYMNDFLVQSRPISTADDISLERKAIGQTSSDEGRNRDSTKKETHFDGANKVKFSDVDAFVRSILPLKDLSQFTEGYTFSAAITYVKDISNLIFFVCEMSDYSKLFEISNSADATPINHVPSTYPVFGVSQENEDNVQGKNYVWRAVKLPTEIDESDNSVVLIDFGEVIKVTNHCQLFDIPAKFRDCPPLAIKCFLKAVYGPDGIVLQNYETCVKALSKNEFKITKFRVVERSCRALHLAIVMEDINHGESKIFTRDQNITHKTNPFLDSFALEDESEKDEIVDALCVPISTVYNGDLSPRVGPHFNVKAKIGDQLHVVVTHVNSPISFYAHIENYEDICEVFFWSDDEIMPAQKEISPPKLNDILLAQYTKDEQWYRAQVIEILHNAEQKYQVFYIDFGNIEIVTLNMLASCKSDLAQKPSKAVPFRLANLKLTHGTDEKENNIIKSDSCVDMNGQKLKDATDSVVVILLNQLVAVEVTDRHGAELVVRFLDDMFTVIPSMLVKMGVAENS